MADERKRSRWPSAVLGLLQLYPLSIEPTEWRCMDCFRKWRLLHSTMIVAAILVLQGSMVRGSGERGQKENENAMHETLHPVRRDGGWGYVDNNGKPVIAPQFEWAKDFFADRAAVYTGARAGYVRPDGSWVVVLPGGAFPIGRFSEERAWFAQNRKFGCVDADGTVVVEPTYDTFDEFREGLSAVSTGRRVALTGDPDPDILTEARYGFVDRTGRIVIPAIYDSAGRFGDGLACVRRLGAKSWEYIDRKGDVAFSLESLKLHPQNYVGAALGFSEKRSVVLIDGNGPNVPSAAFVDTNGQVVDEKYFQWAGSFSEGRAAVKVAGKIGFVDPNIRVVISPQFEEVGQFREGLCRVFLDRSWKYIDKTGLVQAQSRDAKADWNDAEDFHGGLARVHIAGEFRRTLDGPQWWQGGVWHYIDRTGKSVAVCRNDGDTLPPSPHVNLGMELVR